MIKKRALICSKCQKHYTAGKSLYYVEDFKAKDFGGVPLVCPACIAEWEAYWKIKDAQFSEASGIVQVRVELANGDVHGQLACTALDDIVAVSLDIPQKAQKKLYQIYKKWYDEKMKDCLKSCSFQESFMRTAFTCETYGGERYEDIAFRLNRLGALETEKPTPDFIKQQVADRWNMYELANLPMPEIKLDDE